MFDNSYTAIVSGQLAIVTVCPPAPAPRANSTLRLSRPGAIKNGRKAARKNPEVGVAMEDASYLDHLSSEMFFSGDAYTMAEALGLNTVRGCLNPVSLAERDDEVMDALLETDFAVGDDFYEELLDQEVLDGEILRAHTETPAADEVASGADDVDDEALSQPQRLNGNFSCHGNRWITTHPDPIWIRQRQSRTRIADQLATPVIEETPIWCPADDLPEMSGCDVVDCEIEEWRLLMADDVSDSEVFALEERYGFGREDNDSYYFGDFDE